MGLAYAGQRVTVADMAGLAHIAALLAAEGRPVHVVELAGTPEPELETRAAEELRWRVADLDAQAMAADPVVAALARAEKDILDGTPAGDAGDCARRLVALRIRTGLDRIDAVLPALGRHLRRSIRMGTFCLYDPERPERWKIR